MLGGAAAIADTVLLLVLGVPYAVLWGVVSFLFSFVPNIGFVIALIPPTLLAFLDGGIGPAIAVVVGYVAINLAFDYVLQPRMMSTSLDLSPVVTIVSILVWTVIIGPMGALLAVPLTIAMRAVLMPFPGAHWFVALLGPVPGATPEDVEAEPTVAEAKSETAADGRPGGHRTVSGRVFRRSSVAEPPVAVSAHGSTIVDSEGREYLDAAGGAVVVSIGHGRREVAQAAADQLGTPRVRPRLRVHDRAAGAVRGARSARCCRCDDPAIYPVSGGSEAIETALKLARATQLARGEKDRDVVIARWGSYHGNSLGALDLSGRRPLRAPYEAWLGRFRHVSAAYPYRAHVPGSQAMDDPRALAAELEVAIQRAGAGRVAAFVAEPIVGATLGAVEPPEGYWPAIADVCQPARRAARRRRGHDRVRADRAPGSRWTATASRRTCSSRPRARPPATGRSGSWRRRARSGRPSPRAAGSSTGSRTRTSRGRRRSPSRCCGSSRRSGWSRRRRRRGSGSSGCSGRASGDHPNVGDIRGRGLLAGVELVRDRETKAPFPRSQRLVEAVVRLARERGLLLYSGTGNANGIDGDVIVLGPPFVVTDDELRADRGRDRRRPGRGARGGRGPLRPGVRPGRAAARRRSRGPAARTAR